MSKIIMTPRFMKDFSALKTTDRKRYQKVSAILMEIGTGQDVSGHLRDDTRMPKARKYGIDDDFRLLFQQVSGEDALIALSVGKHAHVDAFLDGHKGWVFNTQGNLRELTVATATEQVTQVVSSSSLMVEKPSDLEKEVATKCVFEAFTREMFLQIGVPETFIGKLWECIDPDGIEAMVLLGEIEDCSQKAGDLLLVYMTGDESSQADVLQIARGEAEYETSIDKGQLGQVADTSEGLVVYGDPEELQAVLDKETFEQWQLFLHPKQKELVSGNFNGPARLRGVSGSGKTVVGLHRARHLAKKLVGTSDHILYTTFNKALAESACSLLDTLCGPERSNIDVVHLHRWCLDFIKFRGYSQPHYNEDGVKAAWEKALADIPQNLSPFISEIPEDYLRTEVEFILGRFMPGEEAGYMETDRTGRGRPLSKNQRLALLEIYRNYEKTLLSQRLVDFPEFVRVAYMLAFKGDAPEKNYVSVIVDEVQDLSEISLKLLHRLVGNTPNGLLLIGDGTQRIYTRGYSMRNLGIEVSGRSIILGKNYRNTRQILSTAFPLVQDQWADEVSSANLNLAECLPELSERQGKKPLIVRCRSIQEEAEFVMREVKYLLEFGVYEPKNICVMARNQTYRTLAFDACKKGGLPVCHYKPDASLKEVGDADGVRISSLHSAKGHEYGAVFIVGCVDGVMPNKNANNPDELALEKAVLYVGMTRARDILYMSYAENSGNGGHALTRSSFLTLIENNCENTTFAP